MQHDGITVELEGETQKLTFQKPIKAIDWRMNNLKTRKIWIKGLIVGLLIGVVATSAIYFYNQDAQPLTQVHDAEDHSQEIRKLQSTNRIYSLKLAKEGWHWVNGVWENRSVAKLSPNVQDE